MPYRPICGIYLILCVANGKPYVGASVSILNRWHQHRGRLDKGDHESPLLQNSWRKYGAAQFEFTILETCEPAMLVEREQYWMDEYGVHVGGYNICHLAGTTKGRKVRPETKEKLRRANLGKKLSEETRAKMSEARKGRKPALGMRHSDETRAAMSAARRGKSLSDAARKNMSIAQKGRIKSPEHRAKIAATLKGRPVPPEVIAKRIATRAANRVSK